MNTKEEIRLYCSLMEEILARFELINRTYQNRANLPALFVREICYLQFRFICEIIALACLVAHGDIPEALALRDTYEPGKIIKRLSRLKPFFFPQPMELVKDEENETAIFHGRPEWNHLDQQEVPILWGRAGDVLHRTPMVKVLSRTEPASDDFADIFDWSSKLSGLLNTHWITLKEDKIGMFVTLKTKETGRVAVTLCDFGNEDGVIKLSQNWVRG